MIQAFHRAPFMHLILLYYVHYMHTFMYVPTLHVHVHVRTLHIHVHVHYIYTFMYVDCMQIMDYNPMNKNEYK
jgi:hypothetical protein